MTTPLNEEALEAGAKAIDPGLYLDFETDLVNRAGFSEEKAREYVTAKKRRNEELARDVVSAYLSAVPADTVNSVEELDKLPVGSVVRSGGREFYKTSYIEHPWILPYGVDRFGSHYLSKHSRVTLVHRPEASDA